MAIFDTIEPEHHVMSDLRVSRISIQALAGSTSFAPGVTPIKPGNTLQSSRLREPERQLRLEA
jgi:hypothetical protein